MSVPLILTILAGQPRLLARFSAFSGKTLEPLTGVFARICGGDHVAHLINGNASAALAAEGMSPVLGYGMFIFGLLGLVWTSTSCHMRIRRTNKNRCSRCQNRSSAQPFCSLSVSVCIIPEGIADLPI